MHLKSGLAKKLWVQRNNATINPLQMAVHIANPAKRKSLRLQIVRVTHTAERLGAAETEGPKT